MVMHNERTGQNKVQQVGSYRFKSPMWSLLLVGRRRHQPGVRHVVEGERRGSPGASLALALTLADKRDN